MWTYQLRSSPSLAALSGVLTLTSSSEFQNKLRNLIPHFSNQLNELRELSEVTTIRHIGMLALELKELSFDSVFQAGAYALVKDKMLILCPALTYGIDELTTAMRVIRKLLQTHDLTSMRRPFNMSKICRDAFEALRNTIGNDPDEWRLWIVWDC